MKISFQINNFLRVLVPFGLTQALGIYVAYKLTPTFSETPAVNFGDVTWLDFIGLLAFFVIFFFLTKRFKRLGAFTFRFFLTFLMFSGMQAIFGIWIGEFTSILVAIAAVVIFWLLRDVITHNFAMVLTIAGIGSAIGLSLEPATVVLVLIIFSVYDIIAVYKTGHMVKLAQAMIRSRAIFGFVIPELGRGVREKISGITPGEGFMILGSGDVIFPLLLSASLARVSIFQSVVVAIFALAGLFLMHLIFNNQIVRRPMAALPPIALMSIMGYLITNLI